MRAQELTASKLNIDMPVVNVLDNKTFYLKSSLLKNLEIKRRLKIKLMYYIDLSKMHLPTPSLFLE